MANNQDLPTILRAALRAYEHARAVRLQAEDQARAQRERATAELNAAERGERDRLEAAQRSQRALAEAEQARLGDLAAAVTGLEEAARTALALAGLAHIAGAPAAVDGAPAKARRGDAEVSDLFVQAQTGYVALREALYRLAAAQVEAGQGDAARQTLQPLLADGASPFFPAAAALQRESYLRPAREALAAQAWETVRTTLAPWLNENKGDAEARELERQSYLRPAQQALETGQWEAARAALAPWLEKHKEDEAAQAIYGDSYYRPGTFALEKKQWVDGQRIFDALVKFRSGFRDGKKLWRLSYLDAAQTALDATHYEEARSHILAWLARDKDDSEAQGLLWETYFRSGQQAYDRKDWRTATLEWALAVGQKGNFKDVGSLLKTALHRWLDSVEIPAGDFLYGDNKQRQSLSLFRMSRTPVTNIQYRAFVDVSHRAPPSHWANGSIPAGQDNHPVVNVSWDDAQAFCAWAGVRLPTEQQWEKAARGTDGRAYPWGNQAPSGDLCNFNNIVGGTTPVGQYPQGASPYGLLDMAGNVWEWCENAHEQGGRVIRGGAYNTDAAWVGCACRYWLDQSYRLVNLGFRVVLP